MLRLSAEEVVNDRWVRPARSTGLTGRSGGPAGVSHGASRPHKLWSQGEEPVSEDEPRRQPT